MQDPSPNSANLTTHWLLRAKKRLFHEIGEFRKSPPNDIVVNFKENNMLEWHFRFTGLKETPFEGGEYHGVLTFPENFPFSPPSIRFITPNGRFKVNERVCFALSDFHPECWKPAYTVSAVLQGVYSFMMSETSETVGSLSMDEKGIRSFARKSKEFNGKDEIYKELFPIEPALKSKECIRTDINHELSQNHTENSYSEQTEDETDPPLQKRIKETDNESSQNLNSDSCTETNVLCEETDFVPQATTENSSVTFLGKQNRHSKQVEIKIQDQNICTRKSLDETKTTTLHLKMDKLEFPSTSSNKGNLGKYLTTSPYKASNSCNSKPPFKPGAKSQPKPNAKSLSKAGEYQARMDQMLKNKPSLENKYLKSNFEI